MIAQELKILALMPPTPSIERSDPLDSRDGWSRKSDGYSERLDDTQKFMNGKGGPILSKAGKPLKPFTLLDNRQKLRKGVFKPGHNLPTMTIDEYLEEERRRGGIVDAGGEQSGRAVEADEDDTEKADQDTMRAREWDEYTESNPKGRGNTLNRG